MGIGIVGEDELGGKNTDGHEGTEVETPLRKLLKREANRHALRRMEDAARTMDDYVAVLTKWQTRDETRERRERAYEKLYCDPSIANGAMPGNTVIPRPFGHRYWLQMLRGSFLDVIFDCPYDLHEMVASRSVSLWLKKLRDNQKEVLYFRVLRRRSFQQIAQWRGQTDRNILKVYDALMSRMRDKLYEMYAPRYHDHLPLTTAQRRFVAAYEAGEFKKKRMMVKRKSITAPATVDCDQNT